MGNPLKMLGDLNKLRKQATQTQKELDKTEMVVEEGDFRVVITASQKIKSFSVQGVESKEAVDVLNKAIKQSQKIASEKVKELMGDLDIMKSLGG